MAQKQRKGGQEVADIVDPQDHQATETCPGSPYPLGELTNQKAVLRKIHLPKVISSFAAGFSQRKRLMPRRAGRACVSASLAAAPMTPPITRAMTDCRSARPARSLLAMPMNWLSQIQQRSTAPPDQMAMRGFDPGRVEPGQGQGNARNRQIKRQFRRAIELRPWARPAPPPPPRAQTPGSPGSSRRCSGIPGHPRACSGQSPGPMPTSENIISPTVTTLTSAIRPKASGKQQPRQDQIGHQPHELRPAIAQHQPGRAAQHPRQNRLASPEKRRSGLAYHGTWPQKLCGATR